MALASFLADSWRSSGRRTFGVLNSVAVTDLIGVRGGGGGGGSDGGASSTDRRHDWDALKRGTGEATLRGSDSQREVREDPEALTEP